MNPRTLPALSACAACLVAVLVLWAPAQGNAPLGMALASETVEATQSMEATQVPAAPSAAARWIGFYEPGAPQYTSSIRSLESRLGVRPRVLNFYRSIEQGFTEREVGNAVAYGCTPMITLEFTAEGKAGVVNQPAYSLARIAEGAHDAKIRAYARAARDARAEIWIRPFHEMNGSWYAWSGTTNGNTPALFRRAWQHVHDIFASEGASNVEFVWCPNIDSLPDVSSNSIAAYWPGESYVDYMALDGYNFSTTLPRVRWRSFADLYAAPYAQLCALSSTKPIIVAETASVSKGGDKPRWIRDMFSVIPQRFPRIVGVCWFDSGARGHDWPVSSSSAALQAYRLGVANGTYAPGLTLAQVRTGISVRTSPKKPKSRRRVTLYGSLVPAQGGDRLKVTVTAPGRRTWTKTVRTNRSAVWSVSYWPKRRGNYYVKVRYAGDSTRLAGASKLVRFRCR